MKNNLLKTRECVFMLENKISLRTIKEEDIPFISDYWYSNSTEFWGSIFADRTKFPSQSEFTQRLKNQVCATSADIRMFIICFENQPIGFFSLTHVVTNDSGILHAHLCDPKYRKMGIMTIAYPMACLKFCDTLHLNKIVFETPVGNLSANRIKEKLNLKPIKVVSPKSLLFVQGIMANYYELTKDEALKLIGTK